MIRKLFFSIISLLVINSLHAQVSFGIRSGVNYATWKGEDIQIIEDLVDKTDGYIVTKGRTGLHLGGYVNIPISETFAFEPGLSYSKKGYSLKGDFQIPVLKYLGVNARAQVQSHYIDIPLLMKANVYKGIQVYAGPQVSYLVRSTLNAKIGVLGITLFNRGVGITGRFNKLDVGLTGGIGYEFENGLNFRAGYEYGLSPLDKNNNYAAYNRVAKISVGYSF